MPKEEKAPKVYRVSADIFSRSIDIVTRCELDPPRTL